MRRGVEVRARCSTECASARDARAVGLYIFVTRCMIKVRETHSVPMTCLCKWNRTITSVGSHAGVRVRAEPDTETQTRAGVLKGIRGRVRGCIGYVQQCVWTGKPCLSLHVMFPSYEVHGDMQPRLLVVHEIVLASSHISKHYVNRT